MKNNLHNKNLKLSDLTIEEIDKAENDNLRINLKLFPNEINFYYEIRWLYENLFSSITDEFIPISFLFKESGHCFMFGFQQILRLHLIEGASSLRKAIESCAYSIIINTDPIKTRLWISKDSDIQAFKTQIDMIKWQNPKTKVLKKNFDFLSNYSGHANLFGQIHRFVLKEDQFIIGYFDINPNKTKNENRITVMKQLNFTINNHIKLMALFGELFDSVKKNKIEWDNKFKYLFNKYENYKKSINWS